MPWGTRRLVNEDFHTGIVCESCSLLLLPVDHTAVPSSCGDAAWSTRPHPVINLTSNKDVALSHQFMLPTRFCLINLPACLIEPKAEVQPLVPAHLSRAWQPGSRTGLPRMGYFYKQKLVILFYCGKNSFANVPSTNI